MRATYTLPFTDFDYEKLAKDCGATCAYQKETRLVVTGTQEAIDTLSANLDFGPDEEPSNERLAQALNDSGVFAPFTCVGKKD